MMNRRGARAPYDSRRRAVCSLLVSLGIFTGCGHMQLTNASAAPPPQPQQRPQRRQEQQRRGRADHALDGLPRYVSELLTRLPVTPGLSLAVVRGDRVVFAGGFGHRDVRARLPVTTQTQFYIASTTKSFTGTAAKLLADEGRFDLDAPIKKYLPALVLKAPLAAEQITIRDLLTHRSGISNEAINFRTAYTGQHDAGVLLELLASYSKPTSPEFRYSNIGYLVAALAMEKATGETWQQVVERKIFLPLGLKHTSAFASQAKASGDFALPYLAGAEGDGLFTELPYKDDSTMHAAGGIWSSAEDLAKWLVVNMNAGRYDGRQIIPASSLEEILAAQINQKRDFYRYKRYGYGLGWNIGTYNGDKLIHCFGEFAGFRPHVSFMPEHRIGVVVLVNESTDAFTLPDLIACDIYDHLLGRRRLLATGAHPEIEKYADGLRKERDERAAGKAAAKAAKAANAGGEQKSGPTLAPAAYAGAYANPEWGEIVIAAAEDKSLSLRFGVISAALVHLAGDTFEAELRPGDSSKITFKVDPGGRGGGGGVIGALTLMGQTFARVSRESVKP